MTELNKTLEERGKTHGDFKENSRISQGMKNFAKSGSSYNKLSDESKEAIDMILHKVSRWVTGDPNHFDTPHDIAGYATLAENGILKKNLRSKTFTDFKKSLEGGQVTTIGIPSNGTIRHIDGEGNNI